MRGLKRPSLMPAALNLAMWAGVLLTRAPLPAAYFDSRDARIQVTPSGASFRLLTDVDPFLILAERPILFPAGGDSIGLVLLLANLPAALLIQVATSPFAIEPAFGGIGWRAATWVQTWAFAALSTVQWLLLGCGTMAFLRWRRKRHDAWRGAVQQPAEADDASRRRPA